MVGIKELVSNENEDPKWGEGPHFLLEITQK